MSHFVNKCSCGKVLSSCRCFSKDKIVNVVQNGCEDCKEKKTAQVQVDLIEGLKNALLQQWMQQMGIAIVRADEVLEEPAEEEPEEEETESEEPEWVDDGEEMEKESKEKRDQIAVEIEEEHENENEDDEPDQLAIEIKKEHKNEE